MTDKLKPGMNVEPMNIAGGFRPGEIHNAMPTANTAGVKDKIPLRAIMREMAAQKRPIAGQDIVPIPSDTFGVKKLESPEEHFKVQSSVTQQQVSRHLTQETPSKVDIQPLHKTGGKKMLEDLTKEPGSRVPVPGHLKSGYIHKKNDPGKGLEKPKHFDLSHEDRLTLASATLGVSIDRKK